MLEEPSLLLHPWIHSFEAAWPKKMVAGAAWVRTIANPTTGACLGFAAWGNAGISGWLGWLGRKKIQVFESEDESLLMTLCRPWSLAPAWTVFDAEQRRVGHLTRAAVYDGFGVHLGSVSTAEDGSV